MVKPVAKDWRLAVNRQNGFGPCSTSVKPGCCIVGGWLSWVMRRHNGNQAMGTEGHRWALQFRSTAGRFDFAHLTAGFSLRPSAAQCSLHPIHQGPGLVMRKRMFLAVNRR